MAVPELLRQAPTLGTAGVTTSHGLKVGDVIRASFSLTGFIAGFKAGPGGTTVAVYRPWNERYTREAPVDGSLTRIKTCENPHRPECQGIPEAPNHRRVWFCRSCWAERE